MLKAKPEHRHFGMDKPRVLNKYKDVIPEGAIYIGRLTKWGNPFPMQSRVLGITKARVKALADYEEWITNQPDEFFDEIKRELKGKDLVCFCAPNACHGDILLAIAND